MISLKQTRESPGSCFGDPFFVRIRITAKQKGKT